MLCCISLLVLTPSDPLLSHGFSDTHINPATTIKLSEKSRTVNGKTTKWLEGVFDVVLDTEAATADAQ
jgi:hypothetical protein